MQRSHENARRGRDSRVHPARLKAIEESQSWKHIYHDFLLPEWHSRAGDRDTTILLLQQTVAKRDLSSLVIAVNPMYDSLRSDQRFHDC